MKLKENKNSFDVVYKYDMNSDILGIKVTHDFQYDETVEKELLQLSSSGKRYGTDIDEVLIVINNNHYFQKKPELKDRFWDMFIVDAFINNNDRNDNNWGLILNHDSMQLRLSPIYDNGASFYSKSSDDRIQSILLDEFKIKQVIYDNCVSSFLKNNKTINPLKYIEKMDNEDCNKALLRIFPKINLEKIKEVFDNIPAIYNELPVLSKQQKDLYYESLVYKYENVLKPVYNKLLEKL